MTGLGDDGQVFRAIECCGGVTTHDAVAHAEREDSGGDRAGDVDGQDAADIGDLDGSAFGIDDADGKLRRGRVGDGADCVTGKAGGGPAGHGTDVVDEVEIR